MGTVQSRQPNGSRSLSWAWALLALLMAIPGLSQNSNTIKSPAPAKSEYFPAGVFNTSGGIAPTFAKFLRAMSEPSLLHAATERSAVSYRLTWFQPGLMPVTIRLSVRKDGNADLFTKVISMNAKVIDKDQLALRKEGALSIDATAVISGEKVEKLLQLVQESDFWSLHTVDQQPDVYDGTMWLLEGIRNGEYHVVYRYNPTPSRYTEVGRFLAKNLAHLEDSVISIPDYSPEPSSGRSR